MGRILSRNKLYANGPAFFQDNPLSKGLGNHVQVWAGHGGFQESGGRTVAFSVFNRKLKHPRPGLLGSVVVGPTRDAHLLAGTHKSRSQRGLEFLSVGHVEGAMSAVVAGIEFFGLLVVFGVHEIRQHILKTPAYVAHPRPIVIIFFISANVGHGVSAATAAEGFATG